MKKSSFKMNRKLMLIAVLSGTLIIACSREKEAVDPSSPAYHIAESEKLIIPAAIDLPASTHGHTRIATYYAEGVQKYVAQVKFGGNPTTYEWVLNGPQADLYSADNKKVGTHGFWPFWQISTTDSIFAQSSNPPAIAVSLDSASINWLLLVPKSGRVPTGIFANVTYIQRIATKGGKAPATPPVAIHETASVPYTAIYRFTKKNP